MKTDEQIAEENQNKNMYDYWDRKYIGIERPVMADVYIMAIQFDLSIIGRQWRTMFEEDKAAVLKEKFHNAIKDIDEAIDREIAKYSQITSTKA